MLDSKLHIADVIHSRYLQYGVAALAVFAVIVKPFKIRYWRTSLVVRLNKKLNEIYFVSEGINSVLRNSSEDELRVNIEQKYKKVNDALEYAQDLYLQLEKSKFFKHKKTKALAEGILSNFYTAEMILKQIAFEDVKNPDDESLFEFASQLSLGSLQA